MRQFACDNLSQFSYNPLSNIDFRRIIRNRYLQRIYSFSYFLFKLSLSEPMIETFYGFDD